MNSKNTRPSTKSPLTISSGIILGIALSCQVQTSSALIINFDYTYDTSGFFTAERMNTLESAGNRITSRIEDQLTAITSSGAYQFDANFSSPSSAGSTTVNGTNIDADTITIYVGAQSLGGTTLAQAGPGGYSASGDTAYFNNIKTRGQAGDTQGPTATEFAPWGGSMSFNSDTSWYFDNDTSTSEIFSGTDFYSVALHELGHVFGIGTSDAWNNLISNGEFTGAESSLLFGGNITLNGGLNHWADGTTYNSLGVSMDPNIAAGARVEFSELDFAALNDIGWQVTPVPVPPAFLLFASGLLGLAGFSKLKKK